MTIPSMVTWLRILAGPMEATLAPTQCTTGIDEHMDRVNHKLGNHCRFLVKIPDSLPLECAGPVLCAGITMFSPLVQWKVRMVTMMMMMTMFIKATEGGLRVGIVGIGGLGQMGVRLAKAMGNTVTAISTSPDKEEDVMELGADK